MTVYIPQPPEQFLKQIPHSKFIECNSTRARKFVAMYGLDNSEASQKFQRKARQVLAKTKHLLDSLEIRFWLSSGTCLGKPLFLHFHQTIFITKIFYPFK